MCEICYENKNDVRFADLLNKWICSDCMGVKEFSKEEEKKEEF